MDAVLGMPKTERRESTRVLGECGVKIKELNYGVQPCEKITSKLINISSNGLLVESNCEFLPESILKLEINLPHWEKYKSEFRKFNQVSISSPLVVLGRVARIWKADEGKNFLGIKFLNIDKDHQSAFARCINNIMTAD